MFSAVTLGAAPRRGMLDPVWDRLKPRRGVIANKPIWDSGFQLITTFPRGEHIRWREVLRLCEEPSKPLVLPSGLDPPRGMRAFAPDRFDSVLVANTAVELLRQSEMQLYRRIVGLVDMDGIHHELVERLLPHCMAVKVYTRAKRNYNYFSEGVLARYGLPLSVGDSPTLFSDCMLVVDPEGHYEEDIGHFVLTAADRTAPGVVSHLEARLPENERDPLYAGIEAHKIVAALYEIEHSELAGRAAASYLRLSGRLVSFDSFLAEMDGQAEHLIL